MGVGISKVCFLALSIHLLGHSNILLQLSLVDQESKYDRRTILFRYDPAVLVAGITWHQKELPYVRLLSQALKQSYVGHEEHVCCHKTYCP